MPPHKGNVTHHQDHSITPTNFNIMNTIPTTEKTPIPDDLFML